MRSAVYGFPNRAKPPVVNAARTPYPSLVVVNRHGRKIDMRELIADLFVTLDGYAYGEGAPAYFGYFGPDLERLIGDSVAAPQIMLMGRKTYEMMWAIVRDQPVEGADRMNELPKVVFSGTLEEPLGWDNSRLLRGDLVGEIRSLKDRDGDPLRTIGSLSVVKALLEAGLVDR